MPDHYAASPLTPEFACRNIDVSLPFYTEILGFKILYQREEEGFAMLDYQDAHLMLDEIRPTQIDNSKRSWLVGSIDHTLGCGINLQIMSNEVEALYHRVQQSGARVFLPIEEKWYRSGNIELGQRQFIVQDPDGYMLRFAQDLGKRPIQHDLKHP
jgi:uncharacterized glyoxalase superfamily protein PhnB